MYVLKSVKPLRDGDAVGMSLHSDTDEKDRQYIIISSEQSELFRRMAGEVYVGMPVDGGTLEMLEAMARLYDCIYRGISILSYGCCSEKRLAQKLTQKGYDRETSAEAAAYLREHGFIDDSAQAVAAAKTFAKKLYGRRRVSMELSSRGYCKEAVAAAMDEIENEVDFTESCVALLYKKWGEPPYDRDDLPKIKAQLMRYGHDFADIKKALR